MIAGDQLIKNAKNLCCILRCFNLVSRLKSIFFQKKLSSLVLRSRQKMQIGLSHPFLLSSFQPTLYVISFSYWHGYKQGLHLHRQIQESPLFFESQIPLGGRLTLIKQVKTHINKNICAIQVNPKNIAFLNYLNQLHQENLM